MLGSEPLANGRVAEPDEELEFSVTTVNTVAPDVAKCIVYYKKVGGSTTGQITMSYDSDSERYKSGSAFSFGEFGEFDVWAEITMDRYTYTTGKYSVKSKRSLTNAEIRLKEDTFTYEPGGAKEFEPEIESVTISTGTATETVPKDAYTVIGETKGTDAKTYVLEIEANANSNYAGTAAVEWKILPCKLEYKIACAPKVYDGTANATVESIEFFKAEDGNVKVALTENDYTVADIKYDSANVGRSYGNEAVGATAAVTLTDSANSNYTLDGGTGIRTDKSKRCCTENCKRPHHASCKICCRKPRR